jgi:hypothetical protein
VADVQANQGQGSIQVHPVIHDLQAESVEDDKSSSRVELKGTVQRAIRVWSPRFQAATDRVRGASARVKVWTHEQSASRSRQTDKSAEPTNPLYILAAITLGIPALLLIPLVGMNPGVPDGTFTIVMTFLVISAFVTAVVFELKRLADQPSDGGHH